MARQCNCGLPASQPHTSWASNMVQPRSRLAGDERSHTRRTGPVAWVASRVCKKKPPNPCAQFVLLAGRPHQRSDPLSAANEDSPGGHVKQSNCGTAAPLQLTEERHTCTTLVIRARLIRFKVYCKGFTLEGSKA